MKDITFEEYQYNSQSIINSLDESADEETNSSLVLSVYKKGSKTIKFAIEIKTGDEKNIAMYVDKTAESLIATLDLNTIKLVVTKTINSSEKNGMEITLYQLDDNNQEIMLSTTNIERNGSYSEDSITYSVSELVNIEESRIEINFENTTNFLKAPEISEFTGENHLVINGLTAEQLNTLFTNLGKLLSPKLKDEMFLSNIELNEGILNRTNNASSEWRDENEKEELIEAVTKVIDEDGSIEDIDTLKDNLSSDWEVVGEDGGPYICTNISGSAYTVKSDGTIM